MSKTPIKREKIETVNFDHLRPTQTAIAISQIEYKSKLMKDKIMNPLKFKATITRRDITEQKITDSIKQFNSADRMTAI